MIKKIITYSVKVILSFVFFLGGFSFIVMGVYILPNLIEHMIKLGRPNIELMSFLFTGGIAGGAIAISCLGLKMLWGEEK